MAANVLDFSGTALLWILSKKITNTGPEMFTIFETAISPLPHITE
jgi:hypothetical protein